MRPIHRCGFGIVLLAGCGGDRPPPTSGPPIAYRSSEQAAANADSLFVGDILDAKMSWTGYPAGSTTLGEVALGSYLDPAAKKYKALLLVEVRASCGACQSEAQFISDNRDRWAALGIAVVHLVFKWTSAEIATPNDAMKWKTKYDASWAVAADPQFTFAWSGTNYIPLNVLVDPRTLTMVAREEGYSDEFFANVENQAKTSQP